jgi:purine-binding chemotaxis protein CheW
MRLRPHDDATPDGAKHIVFCVAGEEYALPLLSVREIVRLESVAPAPKAPEALRGMMSLRAERVPVLDLSVAFGHGLAPETAESCVLVAEVRIDGPQSLVALAVDGVSRVLDLASADIAPRPRLGRLVEVDFIQAMARVEKRFVPILDLERVLASKELRDAVTAARAETGGPEPEPPTRAALPPAREPEPAPQAPEGDPVPTPGSAPDGVGRPVGRRGRPRRARSSGSTHDA